MKHTLSYLMMTAISASLIIGLGSCQKEEVVPGELKVSALNKVGLVPNPPDSVFTIHHQDDWSVPTPPKFVGTKRQRTTSNWSVPTPPDNVSTRHHKGFQLPGDLDIDTLSNNVGK